MDTQQTIIGIKHTHNIFVAICIWLCISHVAEAGLTEDDIGRIDGFIQSTLECRQMTGLAVSVVHADRVLMEKGYGMADILSDIPMTEDTRIPIGSLTKAFTTALLTMQLQNSTNLSWDSLVKDVLGSDFELSTELLTNHVTLRDLASHRTGLDPMDLSLLAAFPGTLQTVTKQMKFVKPIKDFRTAFKYNNFMYAILGRASEVLAGKPWEDLIQEHLFDPLGMSSSTFVEKVNQIENFAKPYNVHNNQTFEDDVRLLRITENQPSTGSIVSSAYDMSKWMRFHLRKGATPSGLQLIHPKQMAEMYKQNIADGRYLYKKQKFEPEYPVSDVILGYALAWRNSVYRGYRRVLHSGRISDYKSILYLLPDLGYGVFLANNGPPVYASAALKYIGYYITDLLLGKDPWLNATMACDFQIAEEKPWMKSHNDTPRRPLDAYIGVYKNPAMGLITIKLSKSSRHLVFEMGQLMQADLFYNSSTDVFLTKNTGPYQYHEYWNFKIVCYFGYLDRYNRYSKLILTFSSVHLYEFTRNAEPGERENAALGVVLNSKLSCQLITFILLFAMTEYSEYFQA